MATFRANVALQYFSQALLQLHTCIMLLQVFMVLRDWHGGHKSALKRFREEKAMVRHDMRLRLAAANFACLHGQPGQLLLLHWILPADFWLRTRFTS